MPLRRRSFLSNLILIMVATVASLDPRAESCTGMAGGPGDFDGDGFVAAADCDDADPELGARAGEATNLRVPAGSRHVFAWDAPADLGGNPASIAYDLVRSASASNFATHLSVTCIDPSGLDRTATDASVPATGTVFFYLARARSECGPGSSGAGSNGVARQVRDCDCAVICNDGNACTKDGCTNGACTHDAIAPSLVHAPASTATCAGRAGIFAVEGSGQSALHYTWRKNGATVGADSPILTLPAVGPADDGASFTVQVSDACSSAISAPAVLTVFSDAASCAGGIDGEEAPNAARMRAQSGHRVVLDDERDGTARVATHSGELLFEITDLHIAGRGFDFAWTLRYRSREWRYTRAGVGWTHAYDRRIEPDAAQSGHLLVHAGDGRIDSFAPAGALCYEASGFFEELCPAPGGLGYVLTFPDGLAWTFAPLDGSNAEGRITQARDAHGNAMTFSYDPAGRLTTIVDTLGHPIQVAYNGRGLIASVTDSTGRTVSYEYYDGFEPGGDLDDLKSVRSPLVVGTPTGNDFPQGKARTYGYSSGNTLGKLNHNLTSVTNGLGRKIVTIDYSLFENMADPAFDRVSRVVRDDGTVAAVESYAYVALTPSPANGFSTSKMVVKDPEGNVGEDFHDAGARLVRLRHYTGRAPDLDGFTGDVDNRPTGQLRASDPPYFETRLEYNADALPTRVVAPNGNETSWTYDSANPSVRKRGDLLNETSMPGLLGGDQAQIDLAWSHGTSFGTDWGARGDPPSDIGAFPEPMAPPMPNIPLAVAGIFLVKTPTTAVDWGSGAAPRLRATGTAITGAIRGKVKDLWDTGTTFTGLAAMPLSNGVAINTKGTGAEKNRVVPLGNGMAINTKGTGAEKNRVVPLGNGVAINTKGTGAEKNRVVPLGNGVAINTKGTGAEKNRSAPLGHPTSYTDGAGHTWTATYGGGGHLTGLTAPAVTTGTLGGMPQMIHHSWAYNAAGQMVQQIDPTGRVDAFEYHAGGPQAGRLHRAIVDQPGLALATSYEHDALGRLTRVTDPGGHATNLVHDALDNLVRVVDSAPFHYQTDFYYDAADRLVRLDVQNVDELGSVRPNHHVSERYDYDCLDRLERVSSEVDDTHCVIEELAWTPNDQLALDRDGVGGGGSLRRTRMTYDERRLPFEVAEAEGSPEAATTRFDYDGNGNLAVEREGLEDVLGPSVTTSTYDGYDRLMGLLDAEGNALSLHHDASGNTISARLDGELIDGVSGTSVRLAEEFILHDEIDRAVRFDAAHFQVASGVPIGDGLSTRLVFHDAASRVVRTEDDGGNGVNVQYDTASRTATVTDAVGNATGLTYDADSNLTRTTETEVSDLGGPPEVFETDNEYDALDRLTAVVDPAGARQEFDHDGLDAAVGFRDELGNLTRFVHDGQGRLLRTERVLTDTGTGSGTIVGTAVTTETWDDGSRLASSTDENGNTTSYTWDGRDRETARQRADGTVRSWEWDVHGNPVRLLDENGTETLASHDRLGRLRSRSVTLASGVLGATTESYLYDGASRLVQAGDDDALVTRTHDSLFGVLSETQQVAMEPPQTVQAVHDGAGDVTSLSYPSGYGVFYTYDALHRIRTVFAAGSFVAAYDFVGPERVARVSRANGVTTDYVYDGARRIVGKSDQSVGPLVQQSFGWSPADDRLSSTEAVSGRVHGYGYDSLHRLRSSSLTWGGTPVAVSYVLDDAGNRLSVAGGPEAGPYTMNPALPEPADFQVHQYTTTPRGARQYDRAGNTRLLDGGTPGESSLTFDFQGRLARITRSGAVLDYGRDPMGRYLLRTGAPLRFRSAWYGSAELEQVESGVLQASYVYGAGGERLEMVEQADLNANFVLDQYFYHTDDTESVIAVSDGAGVIVERYAYGDHGLPLFFDGGGMPLPTSAIHNPFLGDGRRWEESQSLYADGYDPRAAVWLGTESGGVATVDTSTGGWLGGPDLGGTAATLSCGRPLQLHQPNCFRLNCKKTWVGGSANVTFVYCVFGDVIRCSKLRVVD